MKKTIFPVIIMILSTLEIFAQVDLGEKVPNFKAIDENGNEWELKKHLKGDYLVVYFYPAAFTGGCTQQACSYRDMSTDLSSVGASVVGISGDRPSTLKMFAEENHLNFTLLSDEKGSIADLFGVPKSNGGTITREIAGKSYDLSKDVTLKRWTFILDKRGKLIYRDSEVNASQDGQKVAEFLKSLVS